MKEALSSIRWKVVMVFVWLGVVLPSWMFAQTDPVDSTRLFRKDVYFSDNPRVSAQDRFIDSTVRAYMQSPENCGLSIGLVKNGSTNFYNYGEVRKKSALVTGSLTVYEIGALSASFCGNLLATAIAEKKVSPEDDIRKYLPGNFSGFHYAKSVIKVKHLAEHTSALPQLPVDFIKQENYDPKDPYKHYTREQVLNFLSTFTLTAEPGKRYDYSSLGVTLLGMILERVYELPYETLVKNKVFLPSGMNHTFALAGRDTSLLAHAYTADGDSTTHWHMNAFTAAGGYKSNTSDMLVFLQSYLQRKSLRAEWAWLSSKTRQGNVLYYQSGGTYGSGAFAGFLPDKNCALVILTNSGRDVDYIAIALLNYLQQ